MTTDTPDPRFPNAPVDSYVSEEGWLIIDDEAWTEAEWRNPGVHGRPLGRPRHRNPTPKQLRRREQWRDCNRRRKLAILAGEE
jgi:hypothetical protein